MAASGGSAPVLLRRPLPPLKKKEDTFPKKSKTDSRKKKQAKVTEQSLEVYNALDRQTTRQRTDDLGREADKMKEYHRRLELLFSYGKPRGGDPFPFRTPPKKTKGLDLNAFIDDSYEPPPPVFTLEDFKLKREAANATKDVVPYIQTHLVEKPLTQWHVYETKRDPRFDQKIVEYQKIMLDENVALPDVQPRVPLRQQAIEEKIFNLESYSEEFEAKLSDKFGAKAVTWPSVARPTYVEQDGEILIRGETVDKEMEDNQHVMEQSASQNTTKSRSTSHERDGRESGLLAQSDAKSEKDDNRGELFLMNSPTLFFQGGLCGRSPSPFAPVDGQSLLPVEVALLECVAHGGTKLNLKAHFIDKLPDLTQISETVLHINLSFNDFMTIPEELFKISQLQTLKLRNNPIYEIPEEIGNLKELKTLVLSFCLISSLPPSIFNLESLDILDLSYNRIAFIPEELKNLKNLKVLNVEGNQLTSFPRSLLTLNLRTFNVNNNFTHPIFWKETAPPQPQHLLENCATVLAQRGEHIDIVTEDVKLKGLLKSMTLCDYCGAPKFGQGIRVIKPAAELFGVRYIPILFYVCSQYCRRTLRSSGDVPSTPEL